MIVAVIPARGGSKRIPRKNLAMLAGRPMLHYTIEAALTALGDGRVFVSTEDTEVAAAAVSGGARVIERPPELATDTASTESALLHALEWPEVRATMSDWLMTLPPTSPLRNAQTIAEFLEQVDLNRGKADCYFSVTENRGDFWLPDNSVTWRRLFPDAPRMQQEREPLFEENSAIYLTKMSALSETSSILGHSAVGIPIGREAAIDINDAFDLALAECLLRKAKAKG